MNALIQRIIRIFRPVNTIPLEYREVFSHLYWDVIWYGLLNGTTLAFQAVFMTRQGGSATQVGMLTAVPALVNLIFALPMGGWLGRRSLGKTMFWTAMAQRFFFLLFVPLPMLLLPEDQVWIMILITMIMSIPGTGVMVGFNSFFGSAVPLEWRGYVVGLRNALLAMVTVIFTLISGALLDRLPYPFGYQVVFALGVIGAAFSSYHLFRLVHLVPTEGVARMNQDPALRQRRKIILDLDGLYRRGMKTLRLDAMRGHFARIMGLLFCWHLFQYMVIPIITPFVVNELRVSDQYIGLATAVFNSMTFIGSLFLNRATIRFGNKALTGGSIMLISMYPILTSFGPVGYLLGSMVGGTAWAITGGALYNYLLDNMPDHDRPAYMAWYTLVSNGAILIGSIVGPGIAGWIGFPTALIIFGIGRFLSGVAIRRWG